MIKMNQLGARDLAATRVAKKLALFCGTLNYSLGRSTVIRGIQQLALARFSYTRTATSGKTPTSTLAL